jgi:hypothetical protein
MEGTFLSKMQPALQALRPIGPVRGLGTPAAQKRARRVERL